MTTVKLNVDPTSRTFNGSATVRLEGVSGGAVLDELLRKLKSASFNGHTINASVIGESVFCS